MKNERIMTVTIGSISAQGRLIEENDTSAVVCIDEAKQRMVRGRKINKTEPSFAFDV